MLDLHEALSSASPEHEKTLMLPASRIEATDRQIYRLVCRASMA